MAKKAARRRAAPRRRKGSTKGRTRKQGARASAGRGARKRSAKKARARAARKTTRRKPAKAASKAKRATRRVTKPAAPKAEIRRAPSLDRARRQLREVDEGIPTPPSSLDMNRSASAARTGRAEMREARRDHTETSPVLTGGDVDASWEDAYSVGDEAPGGDNPTPDQDRVDDIGKALGVEYQDNEELRPTDKIADRDKKRWELDPASSEDYRDRD
jgi:hypothetical protein